LENGKYVAPAPIEQAMSLSKFVSQCVLYGNGHPHNVAIIVPDFVAVASEIGNESWYNSEAMCKDPKVCFFSMPIQYYVFSSSLLFNLFFFCEYINILLSVSYAQVMELLLKDLERVLNEHDIKKYEQPKDLLLISVPFSADNEMLTPKLSIRKPNVIKAYKEQLDALYEKKK
jgi:long-chain acyl-CoA synthetase